MTWKDEIEKVKNSTSIIRDLNCLWPPFAEKIKSLLELADEAELSVAVFETYRSAARQEKLFAEGRTKIKQNGMHHYGVACDIVFRDNKGAWTWNMKSELWEKLGAIGKSLGLYWGGDWKGFRDCPHFQACKTAEQKAVRTGEWFK